MPSAQTFSIQPITELLDRWMAGRSSVIDPFSNGSTRAHHRNDLDPAHCDAPMDAEAFCVKLQNEGVIADAGLFDPPYSPRQISEVYKSVGLTVGMEETQSASMYKRVREAMDACLTIGAITVSFGWNSVGFGVDRGYEIQEILLVCHGGAHNDTICVVERKMFTQPKLAGY